jgi:L-alanine-DL-glutamate epimerase-like enolase superfamily enzyme
VEKARAAVGDSMDIMVDANQAFRVDLQAGGPKWNVKITSMRRA